MRSSGVGLLLLLLTNTGVPRALAPPDPGALMDGEPRAWTFLAPPPGDPRFDVSAPVLDSLRILLLAPDSVAQHEAVAFQLRVENMSDRVLDLYLRGRELTFDLVVRDDRETTIWRRLEGAMIPALLRLETLQPGGVLVATYVWDLRVAEGARVPPGVYHVHAELLMEETRIPTPPRTLRITPPPDPEG